jgi:hypothetical protein
MSLSKDTQIKLSALSLEKLNIDNRSISSISFKSIFTYLCIAHTSCTIINHIINAFME